MSKTPMEILHSCLTNQFFIIGMAILLFLLMVTLVDPGKSEAVIQDFWL